MVGSGKTTLLNRILKERRDAAVEFHCGVGLCREGTPLKGCWGVGRLSLAFVRWVGSLFCCVTRLFRFGFAVGRSSPFVLFFRHVFRVGVVWLSVGLVLLETWLVSVRAPLARVVTRRLAVSPWRPLVARQWRNEPLRGLLIIYPEKKEVGWKPRKPRNRYEQRVCTEATLRCWFG